MALLYQVTAELITEKKKKKLVQFNSKYFISPQIEITVCVFWVIFVPL